MNVCVVALGKIGLPLAVQFASKGHTVFGADINPEVVNLINQGVPPFPGEHELDTRLKRVVEIGSLVASTDVESQVAQSEIILVVVPLILREDNAPDFTLIDRATEAIGRALRPGSLVIFETTLPIGTTRNRIWPALCRNLQHAQPDDIFLAFSPERVFSGRIFADLRRYPKLVGGLSQLATEKATTFYESSLDFDVRPELSKPNGVWPMASCEAAEMAKLAETTFRDVNIALANEFASHAEQVGVDVYEVIEAANSQPFSLIHQPGIAVGGHCIPVYPHLYMHSDTTATVPAIARSTNSSNPERLIARLETELGSLKGKRVVILGLAYRGGVKEDAYSGAYALRTSLDTRGAITLLHDPLFDDGEISEQGFIPYHFGEDCDAAVVQADHFQYSQMSQADLPGISALIDGRNIVGSDGWSINVITIGRALHNRSV